MGTDLYFNNQSLRAKMPGINITNISRPARAAYERNKIVIPGKDGTYDFGNNRKKDFLITVEVVVTANNSVGLQSKLDDLTYFIDGKHELYFSDAPSKKYQAQVYDEVTVKGDPTARWARCLIVFECDAGVVMADD